MDHVIIHKLGHDSDGHCSWTFIEYFPNSFILKKAKENERERRERNTPLVQ